MGLRLDGIILFFRDIRARTMNVSKKEVIPLTLSRRLGLIKGRMLTQTQRKRDFPAASGVFDKLPGA
jgi:hypothetical protein